MQIQRVPISRLHLAAYNPRKDLKPGDPEYQKLEKSLGKFGYIEPIVWNERTGHVVGIVLGQYLLKAGMALLDTPFFYWFTRRAVQ